MDPLPPIDLPALIRQNPARWLLLMSLHHGAGFREAVETARAGGMRIFMDGQVARGTSISDPDVKAAIGSVNVFAPNRKEALQLTGETDVDSALRRLSGLAQTVIIKLGPDGAVAVREGTVVHVPGIPTAVVDTTGAGDNFDCGFLYGLLNEYPLEDCLRCGNFCGSRSTTAHGGWVASPAEGELLNYLQKNP
jgi:sugar/nucleoside kinase (ribokinase family)